MSRATSGMSRRRLLRSAAVGAAGSMAALGTTPAAARVVPGLEQTKLPAATNDVRPFQLRVPEAALNELRLRLALTRWPEAQTVDDITQGAQLERVRGLVRYWQTRYDWRRIERRLNSFGQFRTRIDGLGIHFLHVRSRHRDAMPLLLTHGWPGSVVEFADVVSPLTDPTRYGGRAEDAFHLVVPSLPGFGFSDRPAATGWNIPRIAHAWVELMRLLGYRRYVAQGGDWGAGVTQKMAELDVPELAGIHLNFAFIFEAPIGENPTPEELAAKERMDAFVNDGSGYFSEQSTRPQTVGYGLTDSPVGQAAWIFEKFVEWTDSDRRPERTLGYDKLLDAIMMYWLPGTAASSARIYWEVVRDRTPPGEVKVPVGFTTFPEEIVPLPEIWARRIFKERLVYFNRVDRGGHFAAYEQPAIFTEELRKYARILR